MERKLIKHLLKDYDPAVRPVANASEVLTVTFGAALYHIMDVVSLSINIFIQRNKVAQSLIILLS